MASIRANIYVCRSYFGRLALGAVYRALKVGDDIIDVKVFKRHNALGFSEFFRFKFLVCEEIKTVYVTSMAVMMGWEGCPYDDMLIDFAEVDKYADYLSNYLLILRDIFVGYDVRRMDDGTFQACADAVKRKFDVHADMLTSKVPLDVARTIVANNIPKWVSHNGRCTIEDIPDDHLVILEEDFDIRFINRNEEFVHMVIRRM